MKVLVFAHHLGPGGTQFNAIELAATLRDQHDFEMVLFAARGETVAATNRLARGIADRLDLSDHWPLRLAEADLGGAGRLARIRLALEGLAFAGEPNLLRRARDAARILRRPDVAIRPAPVARPS